MRRILDDHNPARSYRDSRQQVNRLSRPGGDDNLIGIHNHAALKAKMPGERLSQRPGSLSRAVTDMTGIEVSHHTRDRSGPQFPGK